MHYKQSLNIEQKVIFINFYVDYFFVYRKFIHKIPKNLCLFLPLFYKIAFFYYDDDIVLYI